MLDLISADGSNDNLIKPDGLQNHHAPPPGCLDTSSQPVVNDPVPHEQHCKNDESDTVLFDDHTQLIESEVAEDAEKRDVFDFFAEFVLSSN